VGECGLDLCTDQQIRETADAFISTGMYDLGFNWLVLDDCWHPTRNANGVLVPKTSSFPNGMKVVADYVHSKGIKFGLYTSVGTLTCRGDPGSYGYLKEDADLFASWGIDYVKMDWCGSNCEADGHKQFSAYLNKTGRPIVLELCRGTYQTEDKWGYAPDVAQIWRATGDHHDVWSSTLEQLHSVDGRGTWSGPYGWAYLDMIMTGGQGCKGQSPNQALHCPGQTDSEYRTEYSGYAITGSPILIGTDIRNFTAIMKELILNKEVLEVNQDYLSTPGDLRTTCGKYSVYTRKLSDGRIAVAIMNLSDKADTISVCFSDVGGTQNMTVRDLWKQKDVGAFQSMYTVQVGVHDTVFVTLTPGK